MKKIVAPAVLVLSLAVLGGCASTKDFEAVRAIADKAAADAAAAKATADKAAAAAAKAQATADAAKSSADAAMSSADAAKSAAGCGQCVLPGHADQDRPHVQEVDVQVKLRPSSVREGGDAARYPSFH